MTFKQVARVGDEVIGLCRGAGHEIDRPFVGHWVTGSPTVFADELAIVRLGDTGVTDCGHSFVAVTASSYHRANGIYIHRVDDLVETEGGGPGHTSQGSPNVDAT